MDHSTIANIFLKLGEVIVGQIDKFRDRKIELDADETKRIADYLERVATVLSQAADSFETGKIAIEQCMELESSVKAAAGVVSKLSARLSENETAMLMDMLRHGVNAPGALSEIVQENQRRALLWYFQQPGSHEQPPTFEQELGILRLAAGTFRGAAAKVRIGIK